MNDTAHKSSAVDEWRAGWRFVLLTAIAISFTPAVLPAYTIGVFVEPLHNAFGWGRGAIQTAILFSTGFGLAGGPLAGWMIERWGVRRTILYGIVGMALPIAACAVMTGWVWELYLFYALIAIVGAGAASVSWIFLIADRFEKSRGLALGVALSGTGVAAILLPRLAATGVDLWGWRGAYLGIAAFGLLVILPLCMLILPRHRLHGATPGSDDAPEQIATGLTLRQAVSGYRFWIIGGSTTAIYIAIGGLIPNIVPALKDKGLSTDEAVNIMSFFGISIIVGRIAVGGLVDRFWAPAIAAAVLVPAAIACFLFQFPLSFAGMAIVAMMIGVATGMEFDLVGFLVGRYFGLAHFARIFGRLYMFLALGAGIGPPAFGAAHDLTGSYNVLLTLSAGLLAASAIAFLFLGRYPDEREFQPAVNAAG
ncbi:MAG: MFS transporter [Caenibius sp.]